MRLSPLAALLLIGVAVPAMAAPYFRLGISHGGIVVVDETPDAGENGGGDGPVGDELVIASPQVQSKKVSQFWSYTPSATGGDGDYTWSATLPEDSTGFKFHPATGAIYGSSPWPGDFPFEVKVSDGSGATDETIVVANILPAGDGDNPPTITTTGDVDGEVDEDGSTPSITDSDPDTGIDLDVGDVIDIVYEDPKVIGSVDIGLLPTACSTGTFYEIEASYFDDLGNRTAIDIFRVDDEDCTDATRPPTIWTIVNTVRWDVPSGWYLRSTCSRVTEVDIVSTLPWPGSSAPPAFRANDPPHDVYAGEHCLGGQYVGAADPDSFENANVMSFWDERGCLGANNTLCRYAHVRTYVQFNSSKSWSTGVPTYENVRFSGGAYTHLQLRVVDMSPGAVLRADALYIAEGTPTSGGGSSGGGTTDPEAGGMVSVDVAQSAKRRLPNAFSIPYVLDGGSGTYSVTCENLLAGLSCSNGRIVGTATEMGTRTATIWVSDANDPSNAAVATIELTAVPELVASIDAVLPLDAGAPASFQATATGAVGAVTWSIPSGAPALPGSLTLSSSGLITGTVPSAGSWSNLRLLATDEEGNDVTPDFAIVVTSALGFDPDDPYGAHRYWGLEYLSGGANNVYSVADLQFIDQPGGADQTGSGIAYLTTTYGSDVAARAFDASTSTFASTNTIAPTQRIWYDFGAGGEVRVHQMTLTARNQGSQTPTDWNVIYSDDGVNWTTAWRVGQMSGWAGGTTRTFTSPDYGYVAPDGPEPYGKHRFWGLRLTQGGANTVRTLGEIELRAVPGGTSVTAGGQPGSTAYYGGMPPAQAFDGNTGTLYSGTDNPPMVWYDFRAGHEIGIAEIAIYPRSSQLNQTPTGWDVVYSDDGVNWTTAWSNTTTSWSAQWRVFTSPDIQ